MRVNNHSSKHEMIHHERMNEWIVGRVDGWVGMALWRLFGCYEYYWYRLSCTMNRISWYCYSL
jgi:hypothetical protein